MVTTFASDFMNLQHRISTFVHLSRIFGLAARNAAWPGYECGLSQEEYNEFLAARQLAQVQNQWFNQENIDRALAGLAEMLDEEDLNKWLANYELPDDFNNESVGIVMAGNIPLVGLHDLLCALIAGYSVKAKLSSDDTPLMMATIKVLTLLNEPLASRVEVVSGKMTGYQRVIATGSNNSARYFEQYFGHVPLLIRKNRTSVAVIDGDESEDELKALGDDIFTYFGLGCRNVSRLFIPRDFELDRLFAALMPWNEVVNHNKYANNYDYNKAVWLLNNENLLDNGFVLLKEDEDLYAPTASLYYSRYESRDALDAYFKSHEEEVQCIVGRRHIPFGQAQHPKVWDYADGVDTIQWLIGKQR